MLSKNLIGIVEAAYGSQSQSPSPNRQEQVLRLLEQMESSVVLQSADKSMEIATSPYELRLNGNPIQRLVYGANLVGRSVTCQRPWIGGDKCVGKLQCAIVIFTDNHIELHALPASNPSRFESGLLCKAVQPITLDQIVCIGKETKLSVAIPDEPETAIIPDTSLAPSANS